MAEFVLRLTVESEEVPGRGWVIEAPEVNAIAQGDTLEEARQNLMELISHYPEVLTELVRSAADLEHPPTVELAV
jgi:predicted RNase H-like HicB family nuclease